MPFPKISLWLRVAFGIGMLSGAVWAAVPPLPIVKDAEVAVVDSGTAKGPQFVYRVSVEGNISDPPDEYYRVFFELVTTNSGRPLQQALNRAHFLAGETIGPSNPDYAGDLGNYRLPLMMFDESRTFVSAEWRYFDQRPPDNLIFARRIRNLTEFYVGYRFVAADGSHFGWMKFSRPSTVFTNAFDLTAYEWNPIPDAPIRAGLPPEIPLVPKVIAGRLYISWPAAVANWVLEYSDELGSATLWLPVLDTSAVATPPATGRFYRLRKP